MKSRIKRREFLKIAAVSPSVAKVAAQNLTAGAGFDFIIVGAGSAGCVLAHRLSADPSTRVLLIEAGRSGEADPAITTPGRWVSLMGSSYDWAHKTEAEPGLLGRSLAFPRGKAHGGSSAINAMTHVRGHRLCFDRWRALGNEGWGYDEVLPLFKASERSDDGASRYRGGAGPLAVSHGLDPHAGHHAFLAAAGENGFKADPRFDFNGPTPDEVAGFYPKNILHGQRHSAAAAFLVPVLGRSNLEVKSGVQVTRLIFDKDRVAGVEYLSDGALAIARTSREVILCGGVVESPKLLMLSGIGPADHLKSLGIEVRADVPGVGANLQDHLKLSIRFEGKTVLPGSTVTAGLFTHSSKSGRSGPAPADLQFYVGRGADQPDRFVTLTVSHTAPRSRGFIRLRSTDPLAAPIIQANYLEHASDLEAFVKAVHLTRALGNSRAYEALRGAEIEPGPAVKTDADLATFVRSKADTIFHSVGTCRMGPSRDRNAVVDPQLRVRGVSGLRVADGSIMPEVVNATTHAACVMIGEKASALLLGKASA